MNIRNYFAVIISLFVLGPFAEAQIVAGKAINITISNVPDQDQRTINNVYPVSEGGTINVPFIGTVRAAGMRNEELAMYLQSRFKSEGIYNNPTIQVIGDKIGGSVAEEIVTIGGQVRRSGPVPYAKELTIWAAVQAAGGPTEFGSMNRVTLFRDGKSRSYDLTKAQFKMVPLQRNDTIEVPQKDWLGR